MWKKSFENQNQNHPQRETKVFTLAKHQKNLETIKAFWEVFNTLKRLADIEGINRAHIYEAATLLHENFGGSPSHIKSFFLHTTRGRINSSEFAESMQRLYNNNQITLSPNVDMDMRSPIEYTTALELVRTFPMIKNIHLNLDTPAEWTSPYQKQANTDFTVTLEGKWGPKKVYLDQKCGKDMYSHLTRGHVGILAYDDNGEIIQTGPEPFKPLDPFIDSLHNEYQKKLTWVTKNDNDSMSEYIVQPAINRLRAISATPGNALEKHKEFTNVLWTDIQAHPSFKRSVSTILFKTGAVNTKLTDTQLEEFAKHFKNYLPAGTYDLSKAPQKKIVFHACIKTFHAMGIKIEKPLKAIHQVAILDKTLIEVLDDTSKTFILSNFK